MAHLPLDVIRKELDAEDKLARRKCDETSSELDKVVVSLSSGALVFSMTFVRYLAPQRIWLPILFLSWLAFTAAIVIVAWSIRQSQKHLVITILRHDNLRKDLDKLEADKAISADYTVRANLLKDIGRLNNLAIACFISGLILFGIFVGRNLVSYQPPPLEDNHRPPSTSF
jgi:hypothetical protein